MATSGFIMMPLRGYVPPGGELDVYYDQLRLTQMLYAPFWEGCDVPYMYSRTVTGSTLTAVRPTTLVAGQEPRWNTNPVTNVGAPAHSGHIGQLVHAGNGTGSIAKAWQWTDVINPVISPFIVGINFAVLLVGTPLTLSSDASPGNSVRTFWYLINSLGQLVHRAAVNYSTGRFLWQEFAETTSTVGVIPIFGERVAMLFVHGEEGSVTVPPRVFVGREDGTMEREDFSSAGNISVQTARHIGCFAFPGGLKDEANAGGIWENFAFFFRNFTEDEARAIMRDALGTYKMDPYPVRRDPAEFVDKNQLPPRVQTCTVSGRDLPADTVGREVPVDVADRTVPGPDESGDRGTDVEDHPSPRETDVDPHSPCS